MTGLPLLDFAESVRQRDTALARVEAHADDSWLARARAVVLSVSASRTEFTSDDLWSAGLPKPREPRALGAVLRELARQGLIESTGRFVRTTQVSRHAAPILVWRRAP